MAGQTDLYHKLLGIPRKEQPPTHYRLLGLAPFESDHDVIDAAADRQMIYLRTLRNGDAEQLLNEVARARICLLDRTKKAAYDRSLLGKPGDCELDPEKVAAAPPIPAECKLDPVPAEPVPGETELLFEIRDCNGPYVPLGPYSESQILEHGSAGQLHQEMEIRLLPDGKWCSITETWASQDQEWQSLRGSFSYQSPGPFKLRDRTQDIVATLWKIVKGVPGSIDAGLRAIAGEGNDILYRFLQVIFFLAFFAVGVVLTLFALAVV